MVGGERIDTERTVAMAPETTLPAPLPGLQPGMLRLLRPGGRHNLAALTAQLQRLGMTEQEVSRVFATFNAGFPALAR